MFDAIMKYLNDVLLLDLVVKSLSKREELLAQHDAFLASRCNIFVGGEQLMKQFDKQLAQGKLLLCFNTCIMLIVVYKYLHCTNLTYFVPLHCKTKEIL